jgi:uncharacterized RDD family membrane protein YckC
MSEEPLIASPRRRAAAFLIDHFILTFIILTPAFLLMDWNSQEQFSPVVMMTVGIGMIVYFFKDAVKGISPGKYLFGLSVKMENSPNTKPSTLKLFLRNVTQVIWPIEFLVMKRSKKNQRLGDRFTGCIVVKQENTLPWYVIIPIIVAIFYVFAFGAGYTAKYIITKSDAYPVAKYYIAGYQPLIDKVGELKGITLTEPATLNIHNGYGHALLGFDVRGSNSTEHIVVLLEKKPDGEWVAVKAELSPE